MLSSRARALAGAIAGLGLGLAIGRATAPPSSPPSPSMPDAGPTLALDEAPARPARPANLGPEPGCPQPPPPAPVASMACGGPEADPGDQADRYPQSGSDEAYASIYRPDGGGGAPLALEDEPALLALAAYRGRKPEPLGEGYLFNGVPLRVYQLDVNEPVDAVTRQYVRQFSEHGRAPLVGAVPEIPGAQFLSYRPRVGLKSLTLVLKPHGSRTTILASLAEPASLFNAQATYPADLPQPGNYQELVVNETTDASGRQRAVSFVVPDRSAEELLSFFERGLGEKGFSLSGPRTPDQENRTWMDTFGRGQESLTLQVASPRSLDGGTSVSLMWIQP